MSNKGGNELEKSSARKRPKGAASVAQEVAVAPTPAAPTAAAAAPASAGERWSAENGMLLLQTYLRILEDRGYRPSYEQIHEAMHGSIPDDMSKEQVGTKLRSLKRKFVRAQSRAAPPLYDPIYQLSERIWGGAAEGEAAGAVTPKAKPTPKPKTEKTPVAAAHIEEEEAPAVVTPKAKPKPKQKRQEAPVVDAPQEEEEAPAVVTPKPKPTPKQKRQKAPVIDAPQEAPRAVIPTAKPTPKRKAKKSPVDAAPQEELEEAEVEEDSGRPQKFPRGQNSTVAPQPAPIRKIKKTLDAAALEEAEVAEEDFGKPKKSFEVHNTTPAPRPKKEKAKSKHLELVATGRSSSELWVGGNRYMLSGLVRLLQQVYPEADEKVVSVTLESMDGARMEEIKEKWIRLQELKLEVASLTAQLAMDLTQSLH